MIARGLPLLVALALCVRGGFADVSQPGQSALWAVLVAALAWWWALARPSTVLVEADLGSALALGVLALISTLWSVDPGATLAAAAQLCGAVLLALLVRSLAREHRRGLAWGLLLLGALAAASGVQQLLWGYPALEQAIANGDVEVDAMIRNAVGAGRAFGTFVSPDLLGAALASVLLLAGGLAWCERGLRRAGALVLMVLLSIGLVGTRSVGAALALAGATAVLGVLRLPHVSGSRARIGLISVVAAFGICAVVVATPRLAGVSHRAHERLVNQETAWRSLQQAPLIGHGHNTFGAIAPGLRRDREPLTRYAHGLLGQTANDLGLIGLVLVIVLIVLLGWRALQALRSPSSTTLELGAAAAVLCGLGHGLIDYDLIFAENQTVLLCCAALLPARVLASRLPTWRSRVGVVLVATCVAAIGTWRGASSIGGQWALLDESCTGRAVKLASVARLATPDARLYRRTARSWLLCPELSPEQRRRAATWSARAMLASPRDAMLLAEHGYVLSQLGDRAMAQATAEHAVQMWPRVGRVIAYQGLAALAAGDLGLAKLALQRARLQDPFDPVVGQLTRQLSSLAPLP